MMGLKSKRVLFALMFYVSAAVEGGLIAAFDLDWRVVLLLVISFAAGWFCRYCIESGE